MSDNIIPDDADRIEALIEKWRAKLSPDNTEPDYVEGHIEDCISDLQKLLKGQAE